MSLIAWILRRIADELSPKPVASEILELRPVDTRPDLAATLEITMGGRLIRWSITRPAVGVGEPGMRFTLASGRGSSKEAVKQQIIATWNSVRPNKPLTSLDLG